MSINSSNGSGSQGPEGPQGIPGPQGEQGIAGQDGATGATGAVGPMGPQGPQGVPGQDGADASGTSTSTTLPVSAFTSGIGLANRVLPLSDGTVTDININEDTLILGFEDKMNAPTDAQEGIFHTIRNVNNTFSLELRSNAAGSNFGNNTIFPSIRYFVRPNSTVTMILRSDNRWYLWSSSSPQAALVQSNTFQLRNNFIGGIQLGSRIGLVGHPFINNVGTAFIARSPQNITQWDGNGTLNLNGFNAVAADAEYINNNNFLVHFILNRSSTNSIILQHGVPGGNGFELPNNQNYEIPPNGGVTLILDGANRFRILSGSGFSV